MTEAAAHIAAVMSGFSRIGERLHPGPQRKLVRLAPPIFHPAKVSWIGDRDLGKQHRIIPEGSDHYLIDVIACPIETLAEISNAGDALEMRIAAIAVRAGRFVSIRQVPKAAPKLVGYRISIIQDLRPPPLILSYANCSVVGRKGRDAIIPDLVNMFPCPQNARSHVSDGTGSAV